MNTGAIIKQIEKAYLRSDLPKFSVGDAVKMKIKVAEADKIRLHPFEGTVIRINGTGARATFTVRKISFGEGVERTFPAHSPLIESIQVVSKGKTNRSRLYYLRQRSGKSARLVRQEVEKTPAPAAS
ncbi:MAG: 50S ribosomal protein L19 [Candidatus Omnitrophota bacterium]|nr:50S ribosomal protein L19 [Candidatus Omnitrophota bacterium]